MQITQIQLWFILILTGFLTTTNVTSARNEPARGALQFGLDGIGALLNFGQGILGGNVGKLPQTNNNNNRNNNNNNNNNYNNDQDIMYDEIINSNDDLINSENNQNNNNNLNHNQNTNKPNGNRPTPNVTPILPTVIDNEFEEIVSDKGDVGHFRPHKNPNPNPGMGPMTPNGVDAGEYGDVVDIIKDIYKDFDDNGNLKPK